MKRLLSLALTLLLFLGMLSLGSTAAAAENPVTLKLLRAYASGVDFNTQPAKLLAEELTGYKLEYDMLPAEDALTKLNLIMAAGAQYDMIMIPNPMSNFYNYAKEGMLTDITSLLEENGQNIIQGLDASWKFIDALRIDGKVYCIPQPNTGKYIEQGNFIRKDWLDALGLTMPTTTDEMLEVLRAIKAGYPDVIPYVMTSNLFPSLFAGSFGVATEYVEKDGQLVSRLAMPQMKEYLAYMNTLFSEKLLDNEFPVNTNAVVDEKIFNGKAAVWNVGVFSMTPFVGTFEKYQPDGEFAFIDYLAGPEGEQGVAVVQGFYLFNAIPSTSSKAEAMIDYINKLYDPSVFVQIYDGVENVHWKYNEEGNMVPIQPLFGEQRGNAQHFIFGVGEEYQDKYWRIRLEKDDILPVWHRFYQKDAALRRYNVPHLAPPIDSVLSLNQQLSEMANEHITKFIAGALPLSQYDSFLDQYMAAGGQQVIDDLNAWYTSR